MWMRIAGVTLLLCPKLARRRTNLDPASISGVARTVWRGLFSGVQ
jgi:hypothetical protein